MIRSLVLFFVCCYGIVFSQTYQLTGNPVNITGWNLVPSAVVNTDFIELTNDQTNKVGGIKLNEPINLKYCDKWRVEFDFRIDGNGTSNFGRGDGFSFWYLANPPSSYLAGGGLGIPSGAIGLMMGFDIFNNSTESSMSKVHLLYGVNNSAGSNIEFNNTIGSSFHSADLNSSQSFVDSNYKHVEVNGQTDSSNPVNWIITIKIDGNTITSQSFAPWGQANNMTMGYFGFSASTGAASARHSIKNVKIYTDKVPINQNTLLHKVCANPTTAMATVDLTAFTSQFVNNAGNYTFSYYTVGSATAITNPNNFQFGSDTVINVVIRDPSGVLCDNRDAKIKLELSALKPKDQTLTVCENNKEGLGVFNLDTADIINLPGLLKKYYKTLSDLNAGINEIQNFNSYLSAPTDVYVKVTTPEGCTGMAKITLKLYPEIPVKEVTLQSCFIEDNISKAVFNLTLADVTCLTSGITKKYYLSLNNALSGTDEIINPLQYISTTRSVYVKVESSNSCFAIAKINLKVLSPVISAILKDKTVCIDEKTDLDAGPGFDGYQWSSGETTSLVKNKGVGTYWVKLKKGSCITTQAVKILAAPYPVISNIDIKNNTITIYVSGGKLQYQYSIDGTNWQSSNTFRGLARGEVKVFVKDFYNCSPIEVQFTVPNLINAITPNGDNINDFVDYSALAYKKNLLFVVYDRYGNKIHEAGKIRNFTWDGLAYGKKVPTGTYWYTLSWNENDKNNTETRYSGWILVKNQ
ncbi:gliding motility-associated C-terminal domain-containing protein [Elizabethkingia anophelis]|nr:gliding motility-associated C-terminal domain-containing protein [Elizabethkingia anophelis]